MRIFGLEITRAKAAPVLSGVDSSHAWWPIIREAHTGAWQQNEELTVDTQLSHYAVFACVTLIAGDIGKLRQTLVEKKGRIWSESSSPAFSPILRKPNRFQNHIQFKEWWITSKLTRGNAYALKQRDARRVVVAEHLLDPARVQPLVAPDASVFYQLQTDNIAGIEEAVTVPASEIVHDRMNCLFHPLVGLSPLFAAGLAAAQGLNMQRQSRAFFGNGARPSGVLTAPGMITQETADRLKAYWDERFSGSNAGKVAVLGDGLKYDPMVMTSTDSQMVEQLKLTAEMVCAAFHVPPFKIGIGQMPTYQNGELLDKIYYSGCLQSLIEQYELCQDDALGIGEGVKVDGRELGVELDLRGLLRMDTATQVKTLAESVKGSLTTINEAREKLEYEAVEGGDVIWAQMQNWPISELAKRPVDALMPKPDPPPAEDEPMTDEEMDDEMEESADAA